MTTKLDKNVREIIAHHGGTVVQRGVTGGNWSNCDGLVEGRLICDKYERNNLAMWIKHHPDAELVESTFGSFYQLKGYCIATGAGYELNLSDNPNNSPSNINCWLKLRNAN